MPEFKLAEAVQPPFGEVGAGDMSTVAPDRAKKEGEYVDNMGVRLPLAPSGKRAETEPKEFAPQPRAPLRAIP